MLRNYRADVGQRPGEVKVQSCGANPARAVPACAAIAAAESAAAAAAADVDVVDAAAAAAAVDQLNRPSVEGDRPSFVHLPNPSEEEGDRLVPAHYSAQQPCC